MAVPTTDREQIEQAIRDFVEAYNAGDLARLLAYYTDDLVKLRAGAELETKGDLGQRLEAVFARFRGHLEVENDELVVAGDLAFTRGALKLDLEPRDGGAVQRIERRYLEIWRRESGRWRVARTMDNAIGPER